MELIDFKTIRFLHYKCMESYILFIIIPSFLKNEVMKEATVIFELIILIV